MQCNEDDEKQINENSTQQMQLTNKQTNKTNKQQIYKQRVMRHSKTLDLRVIFRGRLRTVHVLKDTFHQVPPFAAGGRQKDKIATTSLPKF